MNILSKKLRLFTIIFLFYAFIGKVNGQCSITTTTNASTLVCGSNPLNSCNGILYIGDGTTSMRLILDAELRLTCLGPIQLIVRTGASLDFSSGNNRLYLAEGSSIIFSGGTMTGGDCNASERIYIGTNLLTSCNGSNSKVSFEDIFTVGGSGKASSNSPVCVGDPINLAATPPPTGTYTYSWSGPGLLATPFISSPNYTLAGTISNSGTYQVKMKTSLITNPMVAEITVTVNPLPTITSVSTPAAICKGSSATITLESITGTGSSYNLYNAPSGGTLIGMIPQTLSPTTSTTYYVEAISLSGCVSSNRKEVTVTVNTLVDNTSDGFSSSSFCVGDQGTITYNANNGSGVYPYTLSYRNETTGAVFSQIISTDDPISFNLSPNPTSTTDYKLLTITDAKGCVNSFPSDATARATIHYFPSAPIIGTITQPTCETASGSVVLSGLPISGTWNLFQNGNTVPIVTGGSGTTYTVVGLTAGNYTFKVSKGSCTSSVSDSFEIKIAPLATTWTGLWSNGLPTLSNEAIINANYDTVIHGNIKTCSLVINSGALVIRDTNLVTVQNNLTVNAGATLVIENHGSLVMVSDSGSVTYNGTIHVKKTTPPFERYDYTYWSTPTISTTIATTFPIWRTDYAFRFEPANFEDANGDGFDDTGDDWIRASIMSPGKGYVIMGPTSGNFDNRTELVVFTGKVNNGIVTIPISLTPSSVNSYDDFNLVGNPYPSAVSADDFINENLTNISGTLYFWTHKKDISVSNPGPDTYNYSQDDYAMYNLSGGIGTGKAAYSGTASQTPIPNGYIASSQGFFVEATNAAPLTFKNAMRVGLPSTANSQFFRTASNEKAKTYKDRIRLNLENTDGMFSQQLVGYFENSTLDFDKGYDGLVSDGGNYVSFYSFINDATYRIQGRGKYDKKDRVQLGYFSAVAGTFSITIDSKEGLFAEEDSFVFLEDKMEHVIHDLKQNPYTFNTQKGNFNDRFVLRYTDRNEGREREEDLKTKENQILVSNKNKLIKINSSEEMIDKVSIYDLAGKQIYQKTNVNSREIELSTFVLNQKIVIVKVLLHNEQTITKKIIY